MSPNAVKKAEQRPSAMSEKPGTEKAPKKITPAQIGIGIVMITLLAMGIYVVTSILSQDASQTKHNVNTVTLLKLPPPEIKIKPPDPEIKPIPKKEEVVEQIPKEEAKGPDNDNTPAGDKLGLDADGTAGGDAYGLAARKGGRSLLAGMGRLSLLDKYATYTQIVSNQLKKRIMKRLDEDGGIPKGKLQAIVRVSVDSEGAVVDYKIIGSSGNHRLDEAVKQVLPYVKISEPPPDGMPRTMNIRISSQG